MFVYGTSRWRETSMDAARMHLPQVIVPVSDVSVEPRVIQAHR